MGTRFSFYKILNIILRIFNDFIIILRFSYNVGDFSKNLESFKGIDWNL